MINRRLRLLRQCNWCGRAEGFTLPEMLISLCLTALISGILVSATMQLRAVQKTTERLDAEMEISAIAEHVQDALANVQRLSLISSDPHRKLLFQGTSSSAKFPALIRIDSKRIALRDVEIIARREGDALSLFQRTSIRTMTAREPEEFRIASELAGFRFQYLPSNHEATDSAWLDQWTSTTSLPAAIKIHIEAERRNAQVVIERTSIPRVD